MGLRLRLFLYRYVVSGVWVLGFGREGAALLGTSAVYIYIDIYTGQE